MLRRKGYEFGGPPSQAYTQEDEKILATGRTPVRYSLGEYICMILFGLIALAAFVMAIIALARAPSGRSHGGDRSPPDGDRSERDRLVFAWFADFSYEAPFTPVTPEGLQLGPVDADDVVEQMNADDLAFVIYGGDIGSGGRRNTPLRNSRADIEALRNRFIDTSRAPAIVTLGDNDWSEYSGLAPEPGAADEPGTSALDVLAVWRQTLYPDNKSRGKNRILVERQPGYPENQRFVMANLVVFVIHTLGPTTLPNGTTFDDHIDLGVSDPDLPLSDKFAEKQAREAANIAWMREAFELAESINASGIVMGTQITFFNYFNDGLPSGAKAGSENYVATLRQLIVDHTGLVFDGPFSAVANVSVPPRPVGGRPVLVMQGDTHAVGVNNPLRYPNQLAWPGAPGAPGVFGWEFANVRFVQGNGAARHSYMRVTFVDNARPNQFPFIVEESMRNVVLVGDGTGV